MPLGQDAAEDDVVTKLSEQSVPETVAKLIALISAKGKISYSAPAALAAHHGLSSDLAAKLTAINALTDAVVDS